MSDPIRAAARVPLVRLFERHVRYTPDRIALEAGELRLTYAQLSERADRLAALLRGHGVARGGRVCILSQNHPACILLAVAAMRLGAVVATLNTRLAPAELAHCIDLVEPCVTLVSERYAAALDAAGAATGRVLRIDVDFERLLDETPPLRERGPESDPEDILFVIYTSGTTGLSKGAMLSQRAMLARLLVYVLDYRVDGDDTFVAWSPLFHMASIELGLGMLLLGGKVAVLDGPDLPVICDYLERESLANLIFFPGMVEQVLAYLRARRPTVRRVKKFGSLADLFAPAQIAELSALLGVPYTNTFGSTETGMPPASAGRFAPGEAPIDLAKVQSSLCDLRLVDESGVEVPDGVPGELEMRGPTLFSGYWNAPEATLQAFRDGWYRSGDVFVRDGRGRLAFVDRSKYLIKSGGENVYPAEIERVVLQHPGVAEVIVVRRRDPKWGEVPVLVAATRQDGRPDAEELLGLCRAALASFKLPKEIVFVAQGFLPRNNTGKVLRQWVEQWVASRDA